MSHSLWSATGTVENFVNEYLYSINVIITTVDKTRIISSAILNDISSAQAYLIFQTRDAGILQIQDLTNYKVFPSPPMLELIIQLEGQKRKIPMQFDSTAQISNLLMRTTQMPISARSSIYMDRLKMNI